MTIFFALLLLVKTDSNQCIYILSFYYPNLVFYFKLNLINNFIYFRCRADFHIAPTQKSVVVLDIIEPPEKPYIIDQDTNKIINNKLGPYRFVYI